MRAMLYRWPTQRINGQGGQSTDRRKDGNGCHHRLLNELETHPAGEKQEIRFKRDQDFDKAHDGLQGGGFAYCLRLSDAAVKSCKQLTIL
jgi:hypothetical protein